MANKNHMMLNGKDVNNPSAYFQINLADDDTEVRGFGQPVTRNMAKQMSNLYFQRIENAFQIISLIESDPAYVDLKTHAAFDDLKSLADPASVIVSGVFGKESFLQILAMKNCEG